MSYNVNPNIVDEGGNQVVIDNVKETDRYLINENLNLEKLENGT